MNIQFSKSNTETPRTQRLTEKTVRIFLCASLRSLQFGVAILFLVFVNFSIAKAASTNDITSLVQRGLFEEEANHNLDAAMQSYESAIKLHDKDRKLAATAIFRLGECYRKQGKTNEANAYYQRILTEFADQKQLADLSQTYLPNIPPRKATSPHSSLQTNLERIMRDATGPGLQELYNKQRDLSLQTAQAEALWKHVEGLHDDNRAKFFTTIQPDQLMIDLVNKRFDETQKLEKLGTLLGPQHPEYVQQQQNVKTVEKQLAERADALVWSIEQKYKMLKEQEDALKKRLDDFAAQSKPHLESVTDVASAQTTTAEEDEQIRKIKGMIQNSPDLINVPLNDAEGTPLQSACIQGHLKVAEFLLANGANLNIRTEQVSPPLICAAVHGHKAILDLLLSKGADIEIQSTATTRHQTALMCAANRGYKTILQTLLARGAKVNAADDSGRTSLHYAAEKNYPEIAEILLANKAQVDARAAENITPLHFASDHGNLEVAKVLVDHGADVNAKSDGGFTPLLDTAQNDHLEVAKLLLEHGANTEDAVSNNWNHIDVRAFRPINFAIYRNDARLLKLLLEHHANPNSRFTRQTSQYTQKDITPLLSTLNSALVEILLEHGADPNLADENGETPLHWAVGNQQKHVVELLIAHGAKVNAMNKSDMPPIAYVRGATKGDAGEIRQMLLKAGANENYARARVISIWRDGKERTVFTKDTNNWNHFTLMELISIVYGENESPIVGHGNGGITTAGLPTSGRMSFMHPIRTPGGYTIPSFEYPDFSRITINRLTKNGATKEMHADIRDMLGRADAQKDIPLEWGDIVEIPEQDHAVNKSWEGLSEPRQLQLMNALARNVEIRIKGSVTNLDVLPRMPSFQTTGTWRKKMPAETRVPDNALVSEFGLRELINNSGLLRSSSDVNHIKIRRQAKDAPRSLTVDLYNSDEPWVCAGDVIEIPDRDTTTTSQSNQPVE